MYRVVLAKHAQKALRKYGRTKTFPQHKFKKVLECLLLGKALHASFRDHPLKGMLSRYRELHLAADILV